MGTIRTVTETLIRKIKADIHPDAVLILPDNLFEVQRTPSGQVWAYGQVCGQVSVLVGRCQSYYLVVLSSSNSPSMEDSTSAIYRGAGGSPGIVAKTIDSHLLIVSTYMPRSIRHESYPPNPAPANHRNAIQRTAERHRASAISALQTSVL